MFSTSTLALAFAAVAAVNAVPLAQRDAAPPFYRSCDYLEDYETYHTRFIALSCSTQTSTDFYYQCCLPLHKTESLADKPSYCTPAPTSSSAGIADAAPTDPPTAPPADVGSDPAPPAEAAPAPPADSAPAPPATQPPTDGGDGGDDGDDDDCEDDPTESSSASNPDPTQAPGDVAPAPSDAPASSTTDAPAPSDAPSSTTGAPAPPPDSTTDAPPPASTTADSGDNGGNNGGNGGGSSGGDTSGDFTDGFATFFFQGGNAGACGTVHSDSDFIGAIDQDRYGYDFGVVSSECGRSVHITNPANGKSVDIIIADVCPTCKNRDSIDLSQAAFDAIADESQGMVPISWHYNS